MEIKTENKPTNLTDKEYRFANYYLGEANLNATEAAKLSGYSPNTARQQGSRMLTNVNIKKYIQSKSSEILRQEGITQERVLREIIAIAFTNASELLDNNWRLKPLNEIPKEKIGAVNIKVTESRNNEYMTKTISTNLNAKIKALEFLWELVKNDAPIR